MSEFAKYATRLRGLKFRKDYDSRAGGTRVVIWKKRVSDVREIEVQLWEDGNHRVSHYINTRGDFQRQCACTTPTDFNSFDSLDEAISVETSRRDQKCAARGDKELE